MIISSNEMKTKYVILSNKTILSFIKYVSWSDDFWSNEETKLDLESEITIFRVWIFDSEITSELT
jgi:hypothetical protein